MKLNEIGIPSARRRRRRKRLGRGDSSGHGGTSTKGHKGQKSRSGLFGKPGFEGGQMPLQRRLPKRGFTNIFRSEYSVVNVGRLSGLPGGTEVTPEWLKEKGLVRKSCGLVKVLGSGEIGSPIVVRAHAFSESARAKIEAAGGRAEVIRG